MNAYRKLIQRKVFEEIYNGLSEEDKLRAMDYMRYLKTKEKDDVQG